MHLFGRHDHFPQQLVFSLLDLLDLLRRIAVPEGLGLGRHGLEGLTQPLFYPPAPLLPLLYGAQPQQGEVVLVVGLLAAAFGFLFLFAGLLGDVG